MDGGPTYLARDFVETRNGLFFALVAAGTEEGRLLGCLRYVRTSGGLRKLGTADADQYLRRRCAAYLYHSRQRDVAVHGVPVTHVARHYRPPVQLARILDQSRRDALEEKVHELAGIVGAAAGASEWLGVTGSLLVSAHRQTSDIDLVCYGRARFAAARQRLRDAVAGHQLDPLSEAMWRDAYARRGCSLSFEEYLWHESRKLTKFACRGTKVDLACVLPAQAWTPPRCRKLARASIRAVVSDDTFAFDDPARYPVAHATVQEIVCYTPTYAGQAFRGETVEAAGWLEQADDGAHYLAVGTSREAAGEYVKVVG